MDEEGGTTSNRDGQVIVDGKGLVSQCPDLRYYYDRNSVSHAGVVRFEALTALSSSIQDMQVNCGPMRINQVHPTHAGIRSLFGIFFPET